MRQSYRPRLCVYLFNLYLFFSFIKALWIQIFSELPVGIKWKCACSSLSLVGHLTVQTPKTRALLAALDTCLRSEMAWQFETTAAGKTYSFVVHHFPFFSLIAWFCFSDFSIYAFWTNPKAIWKNAGRFWLIIRDFNPSDLRQTFFFRSANSSLCCFAFIYSSQFLVEIFCFQNDEMHLNSNIFFR